MNISFLNVGDGITVFNVDKIDYKTGNYEILAIINKTRKIRTNGYIEADIMLDIVHYAMYSTPTISASSTEQVFVKLPYDKRKELNQ